MIDEKTKKRGGYYTPENVCDFIVKWTLSHRPSSILEPSCGDGGFLRAMARTENSTRPFVTAVEQDAAEAAKAAWCAAQIRNPQVKVIHDGVFHFLLHGMNEHHSFDAVLGNPPYIRYQDFKGEEARIATALLKSHHTGFSRLSNAWQAFVALCSDVLSRTGVLGMVVPAELTHAAGCEKLRMLLAGKFDQITVIMFDEPLFADISQDTVILLARRSAADKGLGFIHLRSASELNEHVLQQLSEEKLERRSAEELARNWLSSELNTRQQELLIQLANDQRIAFAHSLFEVNTGLTTGENRFFILSQKRMREAQLDERDVKPIISKAVHLKGMVFDQNEYESLLRDDAGVLLFDPEHNGAGCPVRESAIRYVDDGEEQGFGQTYKCQLRDENDMWQIPPHSWIPQAFICKFVHDAPRIVLNRTQAQTTDTLLKIRFKSNADAERITAAFMNSYTLALCEMTGTVYGGGVLALNPGTVRSLRIPLSGSERLDLKRLDGLYREGRIEEVITEADRAVLEEGLQLSREDINTLRSIREKFQKQRLDRHKRAEDRQ